MARAASKSPAGPPAAETRRKTVPTTPAGLAAGPRAALSVLNPVRLARQIVPSRRTPIEHLAFYVTIAGLAAAEVIEPPLAVLILVGHRLHSTKNPALHGVGEAFDEVS